MSTRNTQRIKKTLRALVHRIDPKVKVIFDGKERNFSFNGKRKLAPSGRGLNSQMHDIVHYFIAYAADCRRKGKLRQLDHPEFGLGSDPYRYGDKAPLLMSRDKSDKQEYATVNLQIALVGYFGLNVEDVINELDAGHVKSAKLVRIRKKYPDALPRKFWLKLIKYIAKEERR